jgi:hypothetical protein
MKSEGALSMRFSCTTESVDRCVTRSCKPGRSTAFRSGRGPVARPHAVREGVVGHSIADTELVDLVVPKIRSAQQVAGRG